MIYLDNAATSFPKPCEVADAMSKYLRQQAGNPGRSAHRIATYSQAMIDQTRNKLISLIGGDDPTRLIFTLNTTDALNMAIKGAISGVSSKRIPHVITTSIAHNSISRPLEALALDNKIALTRVNCDENGFVDPDDIYEAANDNTFMIAVAHASNVTGAIQYIGAIGKIAQDKEAFFLVDAAQTCGIVPIDVAQMKIDFLAFPGHKALGGPTGTGALYVSEKAVNTGGLQINFKPWREGGTGGNSADKTQPAQLPFYLEAGTPNTVGIAGLSAAVAGLDNGAINKRLATERKLVEPLISFLLQDDRFEMYSARDVKNSVGVVAFNIKGFASQDVAAILDDSFDIAVRAGLHCAPYIHKRLKTFPDGAVRVSVGAFNSHEDIDVLIEALEQIAGARL